MKQAERLKIAAYAGRSLGYRCLEKLSSLGYQPQVIFIMPDDPHEEPWAQQIATAFQNRCRVFVGPPLPLQRKLLAELKPDIVFVFNWRKILPPDILRLPKMGTIGLHAAPLPKYRGFAPLNWALINGEKETAATLFWLEEELDSGPILAQTALPINESDDIVTLSRKVESTYLAMLEKFIPLLTTGKAVKVPQSGTPTYTCQRIPNDGEIDWQMSAKEVHNLVRALKPPFPPAFTFYKGKRLDILRTRLPAQAPRYVGAIPGRVISIEQDGAVGVLAGGEVIELVEVAVEGKKACKASEIIKSLKTTLGFDIKREIAELKLAIAELKEDLAGRAKKIESPVGNRKNISSSAQSEHFTESLVESESSGERKMPVQSSGTNFAESQTPSSKLDSAPPLSEFIPFSRHSLGEDEIAGVVEALQSDWITMGPRVEEFEKEFAEFIGCRFAIALSSCTAALHLALVANEVGVGDEVIVPSLTFAATANVVVHVGAKPIFADIDPHTLCLDPDDVSRRLTSKTKAIILVHYGGRPGPIDELMKIAKDAGILLIEDAAHAIYAKSRGRMIGSIGNAAGFSFYATKNLCIGEGGMLTTDDPEIAKKVQVLRLHGISRDAWKRYSFNRGWKYEVKAAGFKYNMTDLQAAIGLCQLKKLEKMQKVREKIATTYLEKLINLPGIILPDTRLAPDDRHAWHLFPIRLISEMAGLTRDEFINQMGQLGVGTSVHFLPLHLQPYYREVFGTREGQLPVTEKVAQEIVSLPIYPKMTKLDVEKVIKAICQITSKAGKLAKR